MPPSWPEVLIVLILLIIVEQGALCFHFAPPIMCSVLAMGVSQGLSKVMPYGRALKAWRGVFFGKEADGEES